MRQVTLSATAVTAGIGAVAAAQNVTGVSVCLCWTGNVMRSSRSPFAEDVRHLGYDIAQLGEDLSTFRRIAESSFSRSNTERRSCRLLLVVHYDGRRIFRSVC